MQIIQQLKKHVSITLSNKGIIASRQSPPIIAFVASIRIKLITSDTVVKRAFDILSKAIADSNGKTQIFSTTQQPKRPKMFFHS